MAKKDKITYTDGKNLVLTHEQVNVHYRVGRGGENRPDDVMLVQALFKLIAYEPGLADRQLGVSIAQLPEITGNCDARTQSCIRAFQLKNHNRLLNPYDGVIHPASYENRRVLSSGVRMAITLLSEFAVDASLVRAGSGGSDDLIKDLVRIEPRLKCALT
jgi:hypothetical protein